MSMSESNERGRRERHAHSPSAATTRSMSITRVAEPVIYYWTHAIGYRSVGHTMTGSGDGQTRPAVWACLPSSDSGERQTE